MAPWYRTLSVSTVTLSTLFRSPYIYLAKHTYPTHFFLSLWYTYHWCKESKMNFLSTMSRLLFNVGILSWDILLTLSNLMRRNCRISHVTPEGHPGYGRYWPKYMPPKETDSHCSCLALNAMANHGEWFCWLWYLSVGGSIGVTTLKPRHHLMQRLWYIVCWGWPPYSGNIQLQSNILLICATLCSSHA
jgi:hypothetical protein